MGKKDMKIRRYGHDRKRKRQKKTVQALTMVMLVAAAAVIGWLSFDPIYEFVSNIDLTQSRPESSEPDPGSESELDPGSDSGSSSENQDPEPDPGTGENFPDKTAYLPPLMMTEGNLVARLESLKAQGIRGVVFDLKDTDGKVRYQSQLPQVASNLAQVEDAYDLSWAISAIRQAGMVPIGRVYTFKDHTAPSHMYESAVKYMDGNVNWIDNSLANGGRPWLNPNDPDAQQYMLDIIDEAADAGLYHIVLDGVQFPEGVSLHLATYGVTGDVNKSQVLAAFLAKAEAAAQKKSVTVWPVVNLASASGISDIRYGSNVNQVISATGRAVVEVMPAQFGAGVTSETLTLSSPVLEPYTTVKTAWEASDAVLSPDYDYVAVIQAYTATGLVDTANKTYTKADVEAQVKAVEEEDVEKVIYYNPGGVYPT